MKKIIVNLYNLILLNICIITKEALLYYNFSSLLIYYYVVLTKKFNSLSSKSRYTFFSNFVGNFGVLFK